MRDLVKDRYGNIVYLTDERWEHIVERSPELNGHRHDVLNAVQSGKRRRDSIHPDTFYYNKKFGHLPGLLKEIEIVVAFHWKSEQPDNFIVTAYPA